jgi:hypothetical protein
MLGRRKKGEPKTPHFPSLDQGIVASPQEEKCGVCNQHCRSLNGSLKSLVKAPQGFLGMNNIIIRR